MPLLRWMPHMSLPRVYKDKERLVLINFCLCLDVQRANVPATTVITCLSKFHVQTSLQALTPFSFVVLSRSHLDK